MGPADYGYEEDSSNDGTFDAKHDEDGGEHVAAEDAYPHGGIPHLVVWRAETVLVLELGTATSEFDRSGSVARYGANAGGVGEADDCWRT
jgi:hypothetical protein